MRLKAMLAGMMLGGCTMAAFAQMEMGPPKGAPIGSTVTIAKALDEPLVLFGYQVMSAAKAMPADKYSFAPTSGAMAGSKFDGVRTFAQQATHIISANYYFYGEVSGTKPDVDMKAIEALTKKEDIVSALAKSFAFAHKAVATVTLENAFVAIKAVDGMDTRASLAAFAVSHGYDHYGQMVEYLRMNGVVPPGSK
jgi:uncharacterized damage-inducible protein DinB